MSQWQAEARRQRSGPDAPGPPQQPGARLSDLPLSVSDDVGTRYLSQVRSSGGSGTEWLSQWRFEPGAPLAASTLMIAIEGDKTEGQAIDLQLPDRGHGHA